MKTVYVDSDGFGEGRWFPPSLAGARITVDDVLPDDEQDES